MKCFQKFLLNLSKVVYPSAVYGKENIPEGGALIVSNHLSDLDSVYIRRLFKGDGVYFLAKTELFKNKLYGKLLASYGAIPVDRDNPDIKTLLSAVNVLRRNDKLVIFPEGTRNRTGKTWLLPFKGGSFVLAAKSKKPIVPVVILKKAKIFGKTPIIIGEPFELSDFYGKKLTDEDIAAMAKIVANKLAENKSELEKTLAAKNRRNKRLAPPRSRQRGTGKSENGPEEIFVNNSETAAEEQTPESDKIGNKAIEEK